MNEIQSPDDNEIQSLLISATEAAKLLGVSRSFFYQLLSSGELGPMPVKLGSKKLWSRCELVEWVKAGCPARTEWIAKVACC